MKWTKIKDFKTNAYKCDETNYDLFDKWAEGKGITHYANRYSKYQTHFPDLDFSLAIFDHVFFFKNDTTKEVWLTSQPYSSIEHIREKVLAWCEENGLKAELFDESHSWYNPGLTCLLVITKK